MVGTVFVDESKRLGFRFAAALVSAHTMADARSSMRAQLVRGTRRLHFVHENKIHRQRALRAIADLDLSIAIIESPRYENPENQRTAALVALVGLCVEWEADRLVIERDENVVALDRRVLAERTHGPGHEYPKTYSHLPASQEPLLWIADAVAWSWSRGGDYRHLVEDMGIVVIKA
jgi:hypothetical protein